MRELQFLEWTVGAFFATVLLGSAFLVTYDLWADVRERLGHWVHALFTFLNHW